MIVEIIKVANALPVMAELLCSIYICRYNVKLLMKICTKDDLVNSVQAIANTLKKMNICESANIIASFVVIRGGGFKNYKLT